jgi:hypothetical protein
MRKWNFTPGKLLVVLLLLVTVFGNIYAKYATTQTVNGALKVTANLGTIAMDTGAITEKIIPGVDIEVKHEVKITEKSSIPAYVYLVAETNAGEASKLSFVPSNKWMEIQRTSVAGKQRRFTSTRTVRLPFAWTMTSRSLSKAFSRSVSTLTSRI